MKKHLKNREHFLNRELWKSFIIITKSFILPKNLTKNMSSNEYRTIPGPTENEKPIENDLHF